MIRDSMIPSPTLVMENYKRVPTGETSYEYTQTYRNHRNFSSPLLTQWYVDYVTIRSNWRK